MTYQHKDTPDSFWERMGMIHNICPRCKGTGIDPKGQPHRYTTGGHDEYPPCLSCGGTGENEPQT